MRQTSFSPVHLVAGTTSHHLPCGEVRRAWTPFGYQSLREPFLPSSLSCCCHVMLLSCHAFMCFAVTSCAVTYRSSVSDEENKLRSTLQSDKQPRQESSRDQSLKHHYRLSLGHDRINEGEQSLPSRASSSRSRGKSEQGDSSAGRLGAEPQIASNGASKTRSNAPSASSGHERWTRAISKSTGGRASWCSDKSDGETKDSGRMGFASDGERDRVRRQRGRSRSRRV